MHSKVKMLPVIMLNDVSRSYGVKESKVEALKNVNLEVFSGEFLALCGPSGSGKSTLLNILAGIDKPNSGTVILFRKLLNQLQEKELAAIRSHYLGFIFQSFNLIPVLNAFDNVYYPLILNGHISKSEAKERAAHYLSSVGLADMGYRKPGQLSGGQQQRVAIARALAHKPQLIVADEPTGNLDQVTGESIIELLVDINRRNGTTLVISTHSLQLKARAQRVVEICDGEMTYDSAQ
ncbi:ABC transporter ATP-binding protein [Vagococcus sp. WN89Y]|uniref:ABC transporter ATP-binding protein n=1 Tax=Vagococcus sp. WN89Y TaxID=3457258 RepID=UPI003FCE4373